MARSTSVKWGFGGAVRTVLAGIAALCALVVPQTGAADYIGGGQSAEVNAFLNPEVLIVYQGDMTGPVLLRVPIVKAVTLVPSSIFGSVAEMQFKFGPTTNSNSFAASLGRDALTTFNVRPEGGSVINIPILPNRTAVVADIIGSKASGARARDSDHLTLTCCVPEDSDPPVADAGADSVVNSGGMATLNGEGSFDPDGDTLTYQWEQIEGTIVTLSDDNSPTPTFQAPPAVSTDIVLRFALSVNDGIWTSFADEVMVRVLAQPDQIPVACAKFRPAEPRSGDTVTLDGTCSSDNEGPVDCAWTQTGTPAVPLADPSACLTTFIAPPVTTPTNLFFMLKVTDTGNPQNSDFLDSELMITIRPANQAPEAIATAPSKVCGGTAVLLDGSASFDPDPTDTIVYAWTQMTGTGVTISGASGPIAGFVAPRVEDVLTFRLTVTDNFGASDFADVGVIVTIDPAALECQPRTVAVSGVSAVPSIRRTTR